MNLLIYGATELGYMIALRLYQEHSITLIDDVESVPDKFNNLDISFIRGSAADVDALEQADLQKCELFIACSSLDEGNIVACWTVKKIVDIETIYRYVSKCNVRIDFRNQISKSRSINITRISPDVTRSQRRTKCRCPSSAGD